MRLSTVSRLPVSTAGKGWPSSLAAPTATSTSRADRNSGTCFLSSFPRIVSPWTANTGTPGNFSRGLPCEAVILRAWWTSWASGMSRKAIPAAVGSAPVESETILSSVKGTTCPPPSMPEFFPFTCLRRTCASLSLKQKNPICFPLSPFWETRTNSLSWLVTVQTGTPSKAGAIWCGVSATVYTGPFRLEEMDAKAFLCVLG
mmetsp:Transcript_31027/g.42993  ORF Transcript_31027/g.42993 Transcript_31027/m.42993 type:complete len:202 (+) Transcript_31027:369-974(+)